MASPSQQNTSMPPPVTSPMMGPPVQSPAAQSHSPHSPYQTASTPPANQQQPPPSQPPNQQPSVQQPLNTSVPPMPPIPVSQPTGQAPQPQGMHCAPPVQHNIPAQGHMPQMPMNGPLHHMQPNGPQHMNATGNHMQHHPAMGPHGRLLTSSCAKPPTDVPLVSAPPHPGMQGQPQGPPIPSMGYQPHQMPPNVSGTTIQTRPVTITDAFALPKPGLLYSVQSFRCTISRSLRRSALGRSSRSAIRRACSSVRLPLGSAAIPQRCPKQTARLSNTHRVGRSRQTPETRKRSRRTSF